MRGSRSGISAPMGTRSEMKQTYIDFWTSVETIRAHVTTDGYLGQSYTTDFIGALTLGEVIMPQS